MSKVKLPIDAVIAVTYKCNSRCTMCNIWQLKDTPEVPREYFRRLPKSLRYVNISGGEPFLRQDLAETIKIIKETCPAAKLIISSNGFATPLIIEKMREILKIDPPIGVAISIDGVGEMHDKIRGIPGGFEKSMATVKELQKLGLTNLRLAFTVSRGNISHLSKVYDLANELGVEFTLALAQSSEFFFGGKEILDNPPTEELTKQFGYLIKSELKKNNPKRWARAYFAQGLLNFALTGKQPLPSRAGMDYFFLDPYGDIYPSVVHNSVMGNIKEEEFDKIWFSEKADKIRRLLTERSQEAWMICTARTAIRKSPWKLAGWVLKNKFFKW
ncbi:MAG: radical SAM protein [Patescibacteria group bacterium]|nr:radical SAM protein [Patescibacteria group bacterium]MDD5490748.1 radical SAM protein [Patescibacteria group bacterium]